MYVNVSSNGGVEKNRSDNSCGTQRTPHSDLYVVKWLFVKLYWRENRSNSSRLTSKGKSECVSEVPRMHSSRRTPLSASSLRYVKRRSDSSRIARELSQRFAGRMSPRLPGRRGRNLRRTIKKNTLYMLQSEFFCEYCLWQKLPRLS